MFQDYCFVGASRFVKFMGLYRIQGMYNTYNGYSVTLVKGLKSI